MCFLLCGICTTPEFAVGLDSDQFAAYCSGDAVVDDDTTVNLAVSTLYNVSQMHGYYWLDDAGDYEANATQALAYLLSNAPRRDLILLFKESFLFLDFLIEHVRFALQTRPWSVTMNVTWEIFLDAVLPYSVLNEKRDLWWRWRPRFSQIFSGVVAGAANITDAMHRLANAIPIAQAEGMLSFLNESKSIGISPIPGQPITWRSEVSPAFISPQQVAAHGGSCTGTGIVLVAAARSVGIPARLAGCSESVVRGDDHHWSEFWDGSDAGPFGDYWHTKEGTSAGNAGGPWDSPSGPMLGCLQGVIPGSSIDSMWAGSWGSDVYLPALWSNSSWAQTWSFVGGVNRCGAYCTAWGCGANNSNHWDQAACGPTTA